MPTETYSWQENHLQKCLSQARHVTWHPSFPLLPNVSLVSHINHRPHTQQHHNISSVFLLWLTYLIMTRRHPWIFDRGDFYLLTEKFTQKWWWFVFRPFWTRDLIIHTYFGTVSSYSYVNSSEGLLLLLRPQTVKHVVQPDINNF
jgi:hypothetical protein